ncbi:ATP-dependent DNA helicase [Diaphorobacter sp.]|uniref:ATP-dependent DNA helicase n=1 Tax=Diaphorobacter sp. TaxID=1934310 RepID=UPI003D0E2A32
MLKDLVARAFAPDGPLARVQPHFTHRAGQATMALAVADAMATRSRLVVEAGTGVGKTFAYLVPALLSGERVLVSTATRALQDQLHGRDLPMLLQALALPVRAALLKGRGSYVCLHRLEQTRRGQAGQAGSASESGTAGTLARIEVWAQGTCSGDLAELPDLDEHSPVLAQVTSTRDNCLGQDCPRFDACHVYRARREALAADVVVLNHHLFFADLALRDAGAAPLLPGARVVIFDEAHRLTEAALQFFGWHVGTGQLRDLGQDLLVLGSQRAHGLADWPALSDALRQTAQQLRAVAAGCADFAASQSARVPWTGAAPDGTDPARWADALHSVVRALRAALAGLDGVTAVAPDLAHLHARTVSLLQCLAQLSAPVEPGCARWLDVGAQLRLAQSPLDLAPALRALWQGTPARPGAWDEDAEPPGSADARTWVFTSATLGDDAQLSWFTEDCGLGDAHVVKVDSPFDYARQAAFFVPQQLPPPTDPAHTGQLAQWVGDAAARLGGRTLVLTTSVRALQQMAAALRERFAPGCGIEVLAQGQAPRRQIMERFRAPADGGGRPAGRVLVGSASFWEGFDVPGDALQLVVIDKLPFPAPGDPLVQARGQRLEQAGRSAFWNLAVPTAAVALKQGAGRLIRSESDSGVLVVADTRLLRMGYGKRLLRALPPLRRLQSQQEFEAALDALTRTSTTDCPGA